MRKKVIAAILATTMLVPTNAFSPFAIEEKKASIMQSVQAATTENVAYEGNCGKSAKWKFNESTGELTISGSGKMYDYSYDLEVGGGGGPWGAFNKEIKSVKIGDKITYVGDGAFVWCRNLTTVKFGKKVAQVGGKASEGPFVKCPLESIYIGESFKSDLSDLLASRITIKNIQVSSKNKYYYAKNNLLMNKKKTKLYAIGEPEKRILTIPSTVASIDANAIVPGNIDEIRVANGNKKFVVKDGKLYKKSNTEKVFAYPAPLISFTNASTITLTKSNFIFDKKYFCFTGCENVKTIIIGKDVTLEQWQMFIKKKTDGTWARTSTETGAFGSTTMLIKNGFPNVKNIQVEEGNKDFMLQDGVLYSKDGTVLLYCPNDRTGDFQIPEGVTTLNDGAFFECTKLTNISLSDSVKTMYVNTIKHCEQLEKIQIGDGLAEIRQIGSIIPVDIMDFNRNDETKEFLFVKSNALQEINVSTGNAIYASEDGILYDKEKTILFRYPTQRAKEYVMPDSVKETYEGAFGYFCESNMRYKYDEDPSITKEEVEAHYKKVDAIASEYEKCKVTSIEASSIMLYGGVSKITTEALRECGQCETFRFGSKTEIDIYDIQRVNSICANVEISEEHPNYEINNGLICTKNGKMVEGCLKSVSGDITIPGTVKEIGFNAFMDCDRITGVTVEEGVERICIGAFRNCENLKSVSLPGTITEIADGAFYECDSLTSFNIPAGTTTIGSNFLQGENLESITVQEGNPGFVEEDGILYTKEKTTLCLVPAKKSGTITIPETVVKIRSKAFEGCTQVTKVICGEKLTTIEKEAFQNCKGLEEIELSEQLMEIGENAFRYCKNLKSLTFPDNVKLIDECAFAECSGLKNIKLPANLEELKKGVFENCTSLESVEMPDGLKKVGWYTFYGCFGLKKVKLNKQLTKICMNAFAECTNLKSITIPDSVKTIDTYAFSGDKNLKTIVFGKNLKTVGDNAFLGIPSNATIKLPKKKFTSLKKLLCTSKVGLKSSMKWKKY